MADVEASSECSTPAGLLTGGERSFTRATADMVRLRDRLLHEARQERLRCLEVAKAADRWRDDLRSVSEASTQTDPIVIRADDDEAAAEAAGWRPEDEEAQMEAVLAIQMLGQRGATSEDQFRQASHLEGQLRSEQATISALRGRVDEEQRDREAVQQQVLCLEQEMDAKESALSVAQKAVERRDAELQQVRQDFDVLTSGRELAAPTALTAASRDDAAHVRALGQRVLEQDGQLEAKDRHIAQLLDELKRFATVNTKSRVVHHTPSVSHSLDRQARSSPTTLSHSSAFSHS